MAPDAIDRVIRKCAGEPGLERGYAAQSMPATFITETLEIGARIGDGQKSAWHRDPGTAQLRPPPLKSRKDGELTEIFQND